MLATVKLAILLIGAPQSVVVYGADQQLISELSAQLGPNYRLVSAAAPVSSAAKSPHLGLELLEQGEKAYTEMLFEDAVPLLTRAKRTFEATTLQPEDWAAYIRVTLFLSLTLDAMGDAERSDALLDELAALGADPSVAEDGFPPPFRKKVAERLQSKAAKTGAIRIESDPPGASIFINGRKLGNAPAVIQNLPGGTHTVTLALSGYSQVTKKIAVQAGFGIGAEATPELWEATLNPTATPLTAKAYQAVAENRLPDGQTTGQLQQTQKAARQFAALYVAKHPASSKLCVAVLDTEKGWRGPADFPSDVLTLPPTRERLVSQIVELIRVKQVEKPAASPVIVEEPKGKNRWWLWTGVGAVLVGGATAAAIAMQPEEAKETSGEAVIRW